MTISKKIKIILLLLSLSLTMAFMSDTYSRYVVSTPSNIELSFASWQILVNNKDITDGTTSSLEITPVIEASDNIKDNKIAPSSKGYFDILVNPTEVEMSFDYTVNVKVLNENLPDILISKYAILDKNYDVTKIDVNSDFYKYNIGQIFVDYCINQLGGLEKFISVYCDSVTMVDVYGMSVDELVINACEYNTLLFYK